LERSKENSNASFNAFNKVNLNFEKGGKLDEGGAVLVDSLELVIGLDSGQGGGEGGSNPPNNLSQTVTGGVSKKGNKIDIVGLASKPNLFSVRGEGKGESKKGGVYCNGPRGVYEMLTTNSLPIEISSQNQKLKKRKGKISTSTFPPSASLRRQHQMAKSLSCRNSHSRNCVVSASMVSVHPIEDEVERNSTAEVVVERGPKQSRSSSLTGGNLCCSSINSSCIRNCNKIFLKKFEQEVVSKVWHGAVELGVECSSHDDKGERLKEVCLKEILDNELRDEEESFKREHKKVVHL
jgi:hypothetical protein